MIWMNVLPPAVPTPEQFVDEVRTAASRVGAPFSASVTRRMREVFAEGFTSGAALWKTTNRPGDDLSYRFYSRRRTDTVDTAQCAGLLPGEKAALGTLVTSWSALNGGAPVQSCDFDAAGGLAKTWIFLGGTLPLDEVLSAPDVPGSLRRLAPKLRDRGLEHVRYCAVDYARRSANLYFRVRGPFSASQLSGITSLAGVPRQPAKKVAELAEYLPQGDYVAAVTIGIHTGVVERVAFYATQLPDDGLPVLDQRLTRFFASVPSHDERAVNVVAWSFGAQGAYMKAERSWFGNVASIFRRATVLVSGSDETDATLHT
jgi:4-hydroxyphenylpyruvate 3-dimethylallyltransferase